MLSAVSLPLPRDTFALPNWLAKWLILAIAVVFGLKVGSADMSWERPTIGVTATNWTLQAEIYRWYKPHHTGAYLGVEAALIAPWQEAEFKYFINHSVSFNIGLDGELVPFEQIQSKYRNKHTPAAILAGAIAEFLAINDAAAFPHGSALPANGGLFNCTYSRDNGCAGAQALGFVPAFEDPTLAYDAAQTGQIQCSPTCNTSVFDGLLHTNNQNMAGYQYPVGGAAQNLQNAVSSFTNDNFCHYWVHSSSGPADATWPGNYLYCRDQRGGLGVVTVFYSDLDFTNCGSGPNTCWVGFEPTGAQGTGTTYSYSITNFTMRCAFQCITSNYSLINVPSCTPCAGIGTNTFVGGTIDGGLLPNGNGGTPGGNWGFQHQFFASGQQREAALSVTYSYIYDLTHDPMQAGSGATGGDQTWEYNLFDGYCFGTNGTGGVICHGEISEEGGYNSGRNDTYQGNTWIIESTRTFQQHTTMIYGSGASNGQAWNNLIIWDNTVIGNNVSCTSAYNSATLRYDPIHPCTGGTSAVGDGMLELSYAPYVRHAQFAGNVISAVGFIGNGVYRNISAPAGGGGFGAEATVTISGTAGTITGEARGTNPQFALFPGQGIISLNAPGDGFVSTHIVEGVGAGTWTPLGTFSASAAAGGIMTTDTPQNLIVGATINNVWQDGSGYILGGAYGTVTSVIDATHFQTSGGAAGHGVFRSDNTTATCVGANQTGGGNPNCGTLVLADNEPSVSYTGDKFQGYTYFENPVAIDHPTYWFITGGSATVVTWAHIYFANSGPDNT